MKFLTLAPIFALMLVATACQSAAPGDTAEAKPDPRQGERVRQVCFSSQIRSWRELDRRSVIVEKGLKEEYKLELVGACQPDNAFVSIGLISRVGGGSCLSEGDRLVTDDRFGSGPCSITRIYQWNKDADKLASDAAADTKSAEK